VFQVPRVTLSGKTHVKHTASGVGAEVEVSNPGKVPALEVRLTLRDAKTGERILPAYYEDNYFSLLPGESRTMQIESRSDAKAVRVALDGWNIESCNLN